MIPRTEISKARILIHYFNINVSNNLILLLGLKGVPLSSTIELQRKIYTAKPSRTNNPSNTTTISGRSKAAELVLEAAGSGIVVVETEIVLIGVKVGTAEALDEETAEQLSQPKG